ncbi:hypothetical protein JL39_11805 [Rhizobium sp. YS-1r]|nr:hypothetical protein JL39_11805 [Rhizobium sp. YS-1r]
MTVGLRRRVLVAAGSQSADYPVNTLTFMRVVWFICHNSKGKAKFAIFWMELGFLWMARSRRLIRIFRRANAFRIGQFDAG